MIDKDLIHKHLDLVLASEGFANSPSLQKFLTYIVDKTLNDEQHTLKGYTIGVDVFERGEEFNPQQDNIVRVQAGRLRKALQIYYAQNPDTDVTISLPKGGYTPSFLMSQRDKAADVPVPPLAIPRNQSRKLVGFGIAAALSIVAALALTLSGGGKNETAIEMGEVTQVPTGPILLVAPYSFSISKESDISEQDLSLIRSGLQAEIISKLSRFKHLYVVASDTARIVEPEKNAIALAADNLNAEYVLTGTLQASADNLRITSTLNSAESGQTIWTDITDTKIDGVASILIAQSEIANNVTRTLGLPAGPLVKTHEHSLYQSEELGVKDYLCYLSFDAYLLRRNEESHRKVRDCLETAVAKSPKYSSAWAALSWLYGDEARDGFNVRKTDTPAVYRAVEAARQAVLADPTNAMAHQYLAIAKYAAGDEAGFREAARHALALNPNDVDVLADVGSHLIQIDLSEEGRQMVEKAIEMNPGHLPWYHGSILIYYYMKDDPQKALYHAQEYHQEESLASYIWLAAAQIQNGDLDAARVLIAEMNQKYPTFRENHAQYFIDMRLLEKAQAKLLNDFAKIGFYFDS